MDLPTLLETTINYTFRDRALLKHAVTHVSWYNGNVQARASENEKLEYLGDAILNSIVSILLYKKFRGRDEGFLSNARSCLVKRDTLTEVAKNIKLQEHMCYGNGEMKVPEESKVLSNMLEALIGAIYLDGGIRKTTQVVKKLFSPYFSEERLNEKNPKNILQEYSQKYWGILPRYRFTKKTKKGFSVFVCIGNEFKARGEGKSKKEAEQQAARTMLENFSVNDASS